mmetsp:Transcript_7975/g.17154  ORF Transcript_7975/g.17154 Transcript_7975/m.17154 type:complete len:864 (+) Transcript_7975:101-2692(+)
MAAVTGEPHPEGISDADDSSCSSDTATDATVAEKRPSLSLSLLTSSPTDQKHQSSPKDYRFSLLQSASCESISYESSSTADFENLDLDLPYRWYKRAWSFIMCVTGIFDILAYMEPTLRKLYNDRSFCAPTNTTTTPSLTEFGKGVSNLLVNLDEAPSMSWYCSIFITFLDRLRDYNVVIAFVFSLLWFKQSHTKAIDEYHYNTTIKEDRFQLLSPSSAKTTSSNNDTKGNQNGNSKWIERKKKLSPIFIYYRRIIVRMTLLPVGFYIILFHFARGLMNGKWLYRELLIERHANETVYLTIQDPNEYVTIEVSKAHAKMSTIFGIFIYLKYHFLSATAVLRAKLGAHYIPQLRRKLVVRVVKEFRKPMYFIQQLKTVLQYVRWIKYSIPLIVKLNKLRSNTMATLRKRRQFAKAKFRKLKRLQSDLSKKQTQADVKADAGILIQRVWRAYLNDRHQRVLSCFCINKKLNAAMKIQLAFRRVSLKNRINLALKRKELNRLEWLKRKKIQKLNDEERRRLYELQDEFMAEAKKTINKRLLVRPNTRFAVSWNSLFIFCILVEISHVALKPWLKIPKGQQTDDRKYKSMRLLLSESLIPTPAEETSTCKDFLRKKSAIHRLFFRKDHVEQPTRKEVMSAFIEEIIDPEYDLEGLRNDTNHTSKPMVPWRCSEPILTWRENWRNIVRLVFCPSPLSEWSTCQQPEKTLVDTMLSLFHKKKDKPLHWYCTKPYSSIHDFYRSTWNFIIDQIQVIISIICFLDVFVKVFTGEIDPITGELRPRPFFRRWIFPGLLLQLLVNPAIGSFSTMLFRCMDLVMVIGPVRVLRWCIAVAVPIVYASKSIMIAALHETEYDRQLAQYGINLAEYS